MKRSLTTLGALALAALVVAPADAREPRLGEPMLLDSFNARNRNVTDQVNGPVLTPNRLYVVMVDGAISYYDRREYVRPRLPFTQVCGAPEGTPRYRSPGTRNRGGSGMDAEYVFARPQRGGACAVPTRWSNFQINSRRSWRNPRPGGRYSHGPSERHLYGYYVRGHGKAIKFRLVDRPGSRDNYGQLKITVRAARPADCGFDGWRAWSFATDAACRAGIDAV
jgi:hypothetical protein